MPTAKGRGRVVRYRNKPIPGHPEKYLVVEVMSKSGPEGGHTVAHVKTKKEHHKTQHRGGGKKR